MRFNIGRSDLIIALAGLAHAKCAGPDSPHTFVADGGCDGTGLRQRSKAYASTGKYPVARPHTTDE